MMRDVVLGKITKVICYKLDRISRNLLDFAQTYNIFENNKVEFVSCTEQFDTSAPIGKAMLSISMVFAQMERETIAERITDNYYSRGKAGLYLGGKAPYGFVKISAVKNGVKTQTLKENAAESASVSEIYRLYADEGHTLGEIVKTLNRRGENFSTTFIRRILRNPVYVRSDADVYKYLQAKGAEITAALDEFCGKFGCTVYGKRTGRTGSKFTDLHGDFVQVGMHEGIVSAPQWLKTQRRLDANTQIKNSGRGNHTWLSGLIKCGYCGMAVTAVNGQRNGKIYINCGGRVKKQCFERKKVFTFSEIETAVETELLQFLRQYPFKLTMKNKTNDTKLSALKSSLLNIEQQIETLLNNMTNQNLLPELVSQLNVRYSGLNAKKASVTREIAELESQNGSEAVSEKLLGEYVENWHGYNLATKKKIAQIFIKLVALTDEQINIEFVW
jgi:DNA invertase Pin-like site-specific DNA recombinase